MMIRIAPLLPVVMIHAVCLALPAAEPLAVFESREAMGMDWPRTLATGIDRLSARQ